ncbi:polysaccharide deacetylase family protein [Cohnella faecalis]|uniref:Polysaccharide deacetylase family protein n=1 Tax=Cohnella faecalis TaxID=2315694 RepID=A0A398CXU9_9BACL|nr:polysaccharide deacetylase family protein [Cohnella faecalis]RIE04617.1 polysaccharide deacetylase family protein [Cohnella faecalis]
MTRTLLAVSAAALALALAACSQGDNANAPAASPSSAASPSATPSTSAEPGPSPGSTVSAEPSAPASESPSSSPSEAQPALVYKMNKVYSIVPIDKAKTNAKVVLLTFDDGPKDKETLDPLLDALDKHQAKAIFFVNGYRAKAKPELLKEIDERGQTIGNHSWDHIKLGKEKPDKIRKQIEDVQKLVREITGKTPVFFRPPHASANSDVHAIAKENGLLFMTWSNGSLDWDMAKIKEDKRPQAIVDNVLEQLRNGSNILMHELPWTAKGLDRLLTELEAKGYSFVDPAAIDVKME